MKVLLMISTSETAGKPRAWPVASAESAAIRIWQDAQWQAKQKEPEAWNHRLIEVDVSKGTVRDVPVPSIEFRCTQ